MMVVGNATNANEARKKICGCFITAGQQSAAKDKRKSAKAPGVLPSKKGWPHSRQWPHSKTNRVSSPSSVNRACNTDLKLYIYLFCYIFLAAPKIRSLANIPPCTTRVCSIMYNVPKFFCLFDLSRLPTNFSLFKSY